MKKKRDMGKVYEQKGGSESLKMASASGCLTVRDSRSTCGSRTSKTVCVRSHTSLSHSKPSRMMKRDFGNGGEGGHYSRFRR